MAVRSFLGTVAGLAGALAVAAPAQAAPLLHDTAIEFASIAYAPGTAGASGAVQAARQVIGNMFDNILSAASPVSITSLGRNGSIAFQIAPTGRYITGGQFSEATGGSSGFPESAEVHLGVDMANWVKIGAVRNGHAPNTAGVTNLLPAVALLSYSNANGATFPTYDFTVLTGHYNSIRIVDTPQLPPGVTVPAANMDGFDIAEFQVTSELVPTPVPAPMSLALFGLGLAGLAALRRRGG